MRVFLRHEALQLPDAAVWWRKNGVETHYRSAVLWGDI